MFQPAAELSWREQIWGDTQGSVKQGHITKPLAMVSLSLREPAASEQSRLGYPSHCQWHHHSHSHERQKTPDTSLLSPFLHFKLPDFHSLPPIYPFSMSAEHLSRSVLGIQQQVGGSPRTLPPFTPSHSGASFSPCWSRPQGVSCLPA